MKVLNPDYLRAKSVEQIDMDGREANFRAWFVANKGNEDFSFEQIRAKYKKNENQWPDGMLHQKLLDWGFEVVND